MRILLELHGTKVIKRRLSRLFLGGMLLKCVWVVPKGQFAPVVLPCDLVQQDDDVQSDAAVITHLKPSPPLPTLQGKSLLISELTDQQIITRRQLIAGTLQLSIGISLKRSEATCNRCGNQDQEQFAMFDCYWCGRNKCLYCRSCIMMGKVTTCTPLVHIPVAEPFPKTRLSWHGLLTDAQKSASKQMVEILQHRTNNELLVWAVCGAGKTEMLFPLIIEAIDQKKTLLIATPRTDVVLELIPRIRQAFPNLRSIALYGGSEERFQSSPLVISTTHQTRRYFQYFDVVIIDEIDAFPYHYDDSLRFAVNKAAKPSAKFYYLSATPPHSLIRKLKTNNQIAMINRRYHGYPLPVPSLKWIGDWRTYVERGKLPPKLTAWMNRQERESDRQLLIFVPSINVSERLESIIARKDIICVHSQHAKRKEIVEAFRHKQYHCLITTTILERGVTFPSVDVFILGAENDVFTIAALVQIAGRAGRSLEDPKGDVLFLHDGTTIAMKQAVKQIKRMNER